MLFNKKSAVEIKFIKNVTFFFLIERLLNFFFAEHCVNASNINYTAVCQIV